MSDDTPTEPRESESGQEQATDTADATMAEAEADREEHDTHPDAAGAGTHGGVEPVATRETAPMSQFSAREAGIGAIVLIVGLVIVFAIPLALA